MSHLPEESLILSSSYVSLGHFIVQYQHRNFAYFVYLYHVISLSC